MIYDNIKNLSVYHALPGIAAAEAFLAGSDLSSLTAGKIQLGGGVVVNVNIYEPKTDPKFEAHRNYIDLQYVYDGDEDMECALMDDALDAGEYNAQKDIQFFGAAKAGRCGRMAFTDGDFALFYPQDVHRPGIKNEKSGDIVRKLVFKIPVPEYAHIAHIKQLAESIALPDNAKAAVIAAAERIPAETADRLTAAFFADKDVAPAIEALAGELDITVPLCSLVMYMIFAKQTYYNYLSKGISLDIYNDSMTDFTVWNTACERKTGAPGLLQCGWLENTLKERLYRLGRFQYEPTKFHFDSYSWGDVTLRRGDPVINIHIPEGAPLTDDVRQDSYRRAEQFFGKHVFVCESWLLYPAHRQFLQDGSNIVRFMDDFVMLSSEEHRGHLGDMWRIYGFSCDHSDFAGLPENTGMQRAYKKHLIETGGMTGGGYGIMIVENGTIVNR